MKRDWVYAEVEQGALIPHKWLGRAWLNHDVNAAVYLPIPVNVLAGWLLNAYYRLRCPLTPRWYEQKLWDSYWQGYRQCERDRGLK